MKTRLLVISLFLISSLSFAQLFKKQKTENLIIINTKFGDIFCVLYNQTPKHRDNFLNLAKEHYYDGMTFHRIIKGFMIQGGDPLSKDENKNNDGMGGPGYTIPAEFVDTLTHNVGALAAARMGDQANPKKESNGSQFYIVENPAGTHFLDGNYTVFGKVVKGLEIVSKIADQPKDFRDNPNEAIKMTVRVETLKLKKIKKKYGIELK